MPKKQRRDQIIGHVRLQTRALAWAAPRVRGLSLWRHLQLHLPSLLLIHTNIEFGSLNIPSAFHIMAIGHSLTVLFGQFLVYSYL